MYSLTELIKQRKGKEANRPKPISGKQIQEQTISWSDFYRKNWDMYARYELGIEALYTFQLYILYLMGTSDRFFLMCGRGIGKSFLSALGAFIKCLLYPNSTVVITATTIPTATKMVKNKMEGELCNTFSPKLKYLYEQGYIKFSYGDKGISVVFTLNNSKILVLPEVEASAGERATLLIFEEIRMSKANIINRIFMPMKYSRPAEYRLKEEYKGNKALVEKAQVIYLTSTSYIFEWWFEKWRMCVSGFFNKNSKLRYGIFCGDVITSIYHGFTTQEEFQAEIADPTVSQEQIEMEYYNEPQGGVEGAFYNMQTMKENSLITNAFVPPTYEEFIEKYQSDRDNIFREKGEEEIRAIVVDFATSDTLKATQDNDNTVIMCMSGAPNKQRTHYIRNIDRIETLSGGARMESLLKIRELFYFYMADVFIYDNQQTGFDRFQELSKPFYHKQLGVHMNGFGIIDDIEMAKNFCEENKIINLSTKVIDSNAIPVAIPVVGISERNQNFHVSMQKAINQKIILFLQDSTQARNRYEEDPRWILKSSEEKANIMIGYIQTNEMLKEASELQKEIRNGYIRLFELSHHTKDRIVTATYGNYFYSMLEQRMLQGDQEEDDFNINDWSFLGDICRF